jgi:hypothetical protein
MKATLEFLRAIYETLIEVRAEQATRRVDRYRSWE